MRWKKILSDWNSFTEDLHNKKLSYCTSYVYQINLVDKLIIGVNNLDQLKQILSIKVKENSILQNLLCDHGASEQFFL